MRGSVVIFHSFVRYLGCISNAEKAARTEQGGSKRTSPDKPIRAIVIAESVELISKALAEVGVRTPLSAAGATGLAQFYGRG